MDIFILHACSILDSLTSVDAEGVKVHGLVGGLAVGQLLLPVLPLGQVLHVEVQELVRMGAPFVNGLKKFGVKKFPSLPEAQRARLLEARAPVHQRVPQEVHERLDVAAVALPLIVLHLNQYL